MKSQTRSQPLLKSLQNGRRGCSAESRLALPALILTLAFIGCTTVRHETMPKTNQMARVLDKKIAKRIKANYLLFLPKGYTAKAGERWPLMLFLHGAGERGSNVSKVTVHGPPKIVKTKPDFPFILVSPQCPAHEFWSMEVLVHLLDEVTRKYAVDTNRVYLTGLSMGGYGTWKLGLQYPERFAAIAPICGGGEPLDVLLASRNKAQALKTLGVWAFHGAKDPVVKLEESERLVNALKSAGCEEVRLTVYPEAGHDSWTETYNNPEFYQWLLKHERKAGK